MNPHDDPAFRNDLALSFERAVDLLVRGAHDRHSAAHTPAIATVGLDGAPRLRTVVLRRFDRASMTAWFHSDVRSSKVAELRAHPAIGLLVYDRGHKIQLRLSGEGVLHTGDAVTEDHWARTSPQGRRTYGVAPGPGALIEHPGQADESIDVAGPAQQREQFVVVEMVASRLEWLYLSHAGHRRASFERADGWSGHWQSP
jgi:pyridoxamine 5'-phosphate oxidase